MKKYLLFAAMAVVLAACNPNNPEQRTLVGTWSEQYHVNEIVKSITFHANGTLDYVAKPDTTWDVVIDWGGDYAKQKYVVKDNTLFFSGNFSIDADESVPYAFSSRYAIQDDVLTIDSFAYDGGIYTQFIKPLVLYKVK